MDQGKTVVLLAFKEGKQLDETNYASFAEERMTKVEEGKRVLAFQTGDRGLTTSKLRNIYSQIMNVSTRINSEEDFEKPESKADIQYLKVKMAYEAGREDPVREFLRMTYLMVAIDRIKDYQTFKLYCRYAESLVAYFKFYGGRD